MSHLNLLEEGDTILLSDEDTQYTYTVFSTTTVEPTEVYITEPASSSPRCMPTSASSSSALPRIT